MVGVVQNSQAATIPVLSTAQTGLATPPGGWNLTNTVNGVGLTGSVHAPSSTANAWLSNSTILNSTTSPGASRITFNFNGPQTIASLTFWNLGGSSTLQAQGISSVTIQAFVSGSWNDLSTPGFAFTPGPATATSISGQTVTFTPVTTDRIRFIGLGRQGGGTTGGIGFSEVQFDDGIVPPAQIPEPSSLLALLAVGLGGVSLRKRI
jgi:hypothetical protein